MPAIRHQPPASYTELAPYDAVCGFLDGSNGRAASVFLARGLLYKPYLATTSDRTRSVELRNASVRLDTRSDTLIPIIACKVQPDSVVYTDSFRAYDQLDVTDFHHMRINHSKLFADRENHINGIENFWNQAKRHLRRYNGIPRQTFHLFIKECEWRFNFGPPDQLLKTLRTWLKLYAKTSKS